MKSCLVMAKNKSLFFHSHSLPCFRKNGKFTISNNCIDCPLSKKYWFVGILFVALPNQPNIAGTGI
jgi:hypothetical protein